MHRLNSVYRSVALLVLLCGASSPRAELITIDTTISAKVTSLTALGGSTVGTINSGILAGATAFAGPPKSSSGSGPPTSIAQFVSRIASWHHEDMSGRRRLSNRRRRQRYRRKTT